MTYNVFLPRKKVGVTLLLLIFLVLTLVWIIGQIDSILIINFLKNDNIQIFLGGSAANYSSLSIMGVDSGSFSFIISDFKSVIFGMVIPFGFLISLFSFILNAFSLGDHLLNFQMVPIILDIYYLYIYVLSIDTGYYITLYTIKRQKSKLKSEIMLFVDRFLFLMVLIFVFNIIWWCFG